MIDHRCDRFNLSQMNVSMNEIHHHHSQPIKLLKLPNLVDAARFHSTAINDIGKF
jgi:hypothetical protein